MVNLPRDEFFLIGFLLFRRPVEWALRKNNGTESEEVRSEYWIDSDGGKERQWDRQYAGKDRTLDRQ